MAQQQVTHEWDSGPRFWETKAQKKISSSQLPTPVADYLEHLLASGTRRAAFTRTRHFLTRYSDYLAGGDLFAAGHEAAEGFLAFLADHEAKYATGSILNIVKAVRAFYRYQIEVGRTEADPFHTVVRPRVPHILPRDVPDDAQVRRLVAAIGRTRLRDRAIVEVLYATGIRLSELIALETGDLDLPAQHLVVRDVKSRTTRRIPVGEAACYALSAYLQNERAQMAAAGTRLFVRIDAVGTACPIYDRLVLQLLATASRAARLPFRVKPHALRHACATEMLKRGAPIRCIQQLLGHRSITSTMIYTQLAAGDLADALDRLHPHGASGTTTGGRAKQRSTR